MDGIAQRFQRWHSTLSETPIEIAAIGLELRVRLPMEASGQRMTVIETVNAPGFGPPLHRHPQTEVFRVLEGQYLYEIDGDRFIVDEGGVVSVPGGAAHAFRNITDRPASQLVMILPALDAVGFFTGLGEVMRHGVPDRALLNAFGEKWQVEFLGPPILHTTGAP